MDRADGEIVSSSRIGDPAAFVELVWRHASAVHGDLGRRTGSQSADDLLGESSFRRLSPVRPMTTACVWLGRGSAITLEWYSRRIWGRRWQVRSDYLCFISGGFRGGTKTIISYAPRLVFRRLWRPASLGSTRGSCSVLATSAQTRWGTRRGSDGNSLSWQRARRR